jgi:putative endonuclease
LRREFPAAPRQAEGPAGEVSAIRQAGVTELTGDMSEWSIYMLRCADGSLYTGIATDVPRRVSEHERGKRGAKYLRGRGPFELVYQRIVGDRSVATRIEYCVKQLPKIEKENLQQLPARIDEILNELGNSD